MKYSIVIPIHNAERFLKKCCDTIISQEYMDYEVLLINNGSTDRSAEICDDYAKKYEQFKVYHLEDAGVSKARNVGLSHARGEYIWFVDADDRMIGQPLKEIAQVLDEHSPELVVFSYKDYIYTRDIYEDKLLPFTGMIDCETFRMNFPLLFKTDMFFTVWNKIYQKKFLLANQLFFGEETFGEDTVFNLAVYEKLTTTYFLDTQYYCYVIGRPTSSANVYRDDRLDVKKHEWYLVEKLCQQFGCDYTDLSVYVRTKIFINVANNIVDVGMSTSQKYDLLKQVISDSFFEGILTQKNRYFNKGFKWTIISGNVGWFIKLKELHRLVRRMKK